MAQRNSSRKSTPQQQPLASGFSWAVIALVVAVVGAAVVIARPWHWGQSVNTAATAPVAANGQPGDSCCLDADRFGQPDLGVPPGMAWIPGGTFAMGDSNGKGIAWERPVHSVKVDGFYIDTHEVTNAQFRAFVDATGYVTTAEQVPDLREIMKQLPPGAPPPPKDKLVAGALVFRKTDRPVRTDGMSFYQWWEYVPGADWRHPTGPDSNIDGKEYYPVVQVSWDDAVAYCQWAGKRLPTEAEWEFAARGGLDKQPFTWGDAPFDLQKPQANIWEGEFPYRNSGEDGYELSAPVGQFPPNPYGLYDMAGNVWEWCSDWFSPQTYAERAASGGTASNPQGVTTSRDPSGIAPKRAIRGGSFLCNDSYCASYRPSARMHNTPDSSANHQGFRTVMTVEQWKVQLAKGAPADAPATKPAE